MNARDPQSRNGLRPITPPVSASVVRRSGWFDDVVKPMAQSAALGLSVVNLATSFVLLCVVAGKTVYWIASGCVAATSFLWSLQGLKWRRMDGGDRLLHLASTALLTGITGYIAQCVAIVAAWCVPAEFVKVPAWVVGPWFVFSVWYFPHLEVSMAQRLAVPSMFQDRYLWRAIADWLNWRLKKERPVNHRQPLVKTGRETIPSAEAEPPPPVEERTTVEWFIMLAQEYGTLRRDDSDAGYGLAGKIKGDGRILTKPQWKVAKDWLEENDWIENLGNGWQWKPGATAEVALKQFKY